MPLVIRPKMLHHSSTINQKNSFKNDQMLKDIDEFKKLAKNWSDENALEDGVMTFGLKKFCFFL
jgi:hypothetical protein